MDFVGLLVRKEYPMPLSDSDFRKSSVKGNSVFPKYIVPSMSRATCFIFLSLEASAWLSAEL